MFSIRCCCAALTLLSTAHSLTVFSAEPLETVVVSASRQLELVQDVPIAIAVFSGDQLQRLGVERSLQLPQLVPSLVYTSRAQSAAPYIRGVGTKLALVGLEPSVATYVDDQYYSRPIGSMMELPDVERIEVLKGPQGTLFGRNATGGAIRVVTKTPGQQREGELKLSLGNYDYRAASVYLAGGVTDSLAANVSLFKKQRDGFADNNTAGKDDLDDLDVEMLRSKWLWMASETISAEFSIDYSHKEDSQANATVNISEGGVATSDLPPFAAAGNRSGTDLDTVYNGFDKPIDTEMLNSQLRLEFELSGVDLISVTTYQHLDADIGGDFDASSFVLADMRGEESTEAYSQEFQLQSTSDDDLQWLLGSFFFESEGEQWIALDRDAAGVPPAYLPKSELEISAWALFGQFSYRFDEQWSATLGGRYSSEEKDIASYTSGPTPAGGIVLPTGIQLRENEDDWSEFTPKASIEYRASPDRLYYLSYARGFKSGGFGYPLAGEAVDSEILDMFELGLKSDWLNQRLRFNAALYYYDYQDLQLNRNASAGVGGPVQLLVETAGDAEIYGLEADLSWNVTTQFSLMAGFNLIDSEYSDYDQATVNAWDSAGPAAAPITTTAPFDAAGESLPQVSESSAYINFEYRFELPAASLPLNVTYSYKEAYDYDLIAPARALTATQTALTEMRGDDIKILNVRLAYQPHDGDWELAIWGQNLSDEQYYSEVVGFSTGVRASIGEPRSYGADISYRF